MNRLSLPKSSKEFEWKKNLGPHHFVHAYKFAKILMRQIINGGKKVMSLCESHRQLIIVDHISNCEKRTQF